MRKFRLVRDRRDTGSMEASARPELRGLGDSEIFARSGLFARLAVRGVVASDERLQKVLSHYQLSVLPEENLGHLVLGVAHEQPGQHAIHAIRLLFTAMDLEISHPGATFFLYQFNGTAQLLADRLETRSRIEPAEIEARLMSEWTKQSGVLTLHEPMGIHLSMAGLIPHQGGELQSLSRDELHRFKSDILSASESVTQSSQRQVG